MKLIIPSTRLWGKFKFIEQTLCLMIVSINLKRVLISTNEMDLVFKFIKFCSITYIKKNT